MLKQKDQITVTIKDIDYQGQGVAKVDDFVIFTPGLLTNEKATIEIVDVKKKFATAKLIKLINQSEDRIDHEQTILGSCNLLHVSPEAQLTWQTTTTSQTLKKIMGDVPKMTEIITDHNHMHYRNKSVFHVMPQKTLALGLYTKDQQLKKIETFILADQVTNDIMSKLTALDLKIDPKILKHIAIRTNLKKEALLTLIATESYFDGLEALIEALKSFENIVGVTLNIKDHPKHLLGKQSFTLLGQNEITQDVAGLTLYVDDRSFFQINPGVMVKIYDVIKDFVTEDDHIIDAYSGVGGIGYYLSDKVKHVIMIDQNEQNFSNAMKTKLIHGIGHVEVICDTMETHQTSYENHTLIVDPPRAGLDEKFIDYIIKEKFPKMVYLSCDIKTMARDLNKLKNSYNIKQVTPIRMFFHTTSMETLALLELKT
ncbi:MAG: 23S rRNA (uracil(1939)-C(5))-methyltransferase RlmD [Acholeplasmataceae bacterium]